MKRFVKLTSIIVFVIAIALSAVACGPQKTNYELVCEKVSTSQKTLYTATNEDFDVKLSTTKQEELFIADGKVDKLVDMTILSVMPKDAADLNKTYEYTLSGENEKLTGSITKSKLGAMFIAKVSDIEKIGAPLTLTLTEGENSYTFELENKLEGMISAEEALEKGYNHFKEEIDSALATDTFDREGYVKLITKRGSVDGDYYWYVSFIKDKSDYWSAIIDPVTGEVISSRKNTPSAQQ